MIPDLKTPIGELEDYKNLDFRTFEQKAETALILYHLNRGVLHLNPTYDLNIDDNRKDLMFQIENEIMNTGEQEQMIEDFEKAQERYCKILSCGAC